MKKLALNELNRPDLDTYRALKKHQLIIVLDNIRSLHNVGSIFRTADAFLIKELFLCGITGQPPHKDIHKTALGATESVKWRYYKDIEDGLKVLKDSNYTIYAVEQTNKSINLMDFKPDSDAKIAFVFGNEVHGVSDAVVSNADYAIEIPQYGTKHSFNVAVSTGIILWDYMCKASQKE